MVPGTMTNVAAEVPDLTAKDVVLARRLSPGTLSHCLVILAHLAMIGTFVVKWSLVKGTLILWNPTTKNYVHRIHLPVIMRRILERNHLETNPIDPALTPGPPHQSSDPVAVALGI